MSAFRDIAKFSDAHKRRPLRHSYSHDKSVFSDTAKRSAFSDAAAFSDAQKTCASRHSHSHDKSVFTDKVNKSAFNDAAASSKLRKFMHPGVHTVTSSPCLATRLVMLHCLVTLRKGRQPDIHKATKVRL